MRDYLDKGFPKGGGGGGGGGGSDVWEKFPNNIVFFSLRAYLNKSRVTTKRKKKLVGKAHHGKLPITTSPLRCGRHLWQAGRPCHQQRGPMQKTPTTKSSPFLLCNIAIFCFRSIFQKRKTRCPFMEHRKRSQAKWIRAGKISILVLSIFVLHSKPAQSCMDFQSVIRLTKKMTCRHTINS